MNKSLIVFFLIITFPFYSQVKVKDTITRRANIGYDQKGNLVNFKPETPPLIPIAGAPKPSYSYLWELGDGHYSKEAEPKHVYKNKGTYTTRLTVTNNYDNGKPPATRPKKVVINDIEDSNYKDIASIADQNGLSIFKNCDPIPEQEIQVVVSYENLENYVTNGKLYLFFNEKQFKKNNFDLQEVRSYANERTVKENNVVSADDIDNSNRYLASNNTLAFAKKYRETTNETDLDSTLLAATNNYKDVSILEIDDHNPGETRNVFYTFKTTPEMIKDTSATITMRSIYVPNRSFKNHKIKNLEMEIVTSHDPNKMGSNGSFMNYRLVRYKRVKFKTSFQNNGEGPARKIQLETDIPDMFDKSSLKIEGMYPECPICPKGEVATTSCLDVIERETQIFFIFRNIYLPGSNQKNVKEIDSTKGFVKYSMKFNEDFHKVKTKSRTAIIFDKNEPIITNYATTRFTPGISIGAKAGYNFYSNLDNSKSYFVGATVSPFKSYRYYGQAEFLNSFTSYDGETTFSEKVDQSTGTVNLKKITTSIENKNINWEIPLLFRYNLSTYFGVGAGFQINMNVSEQQTQNIKTDVYEGTSDKFLIRTEYSTTTSSNSFAELKSGLLFDFTAGFARIGPSLGARYVLNFDNNFNYIQLYGIWKF
ncbi:PKD domain-containing protein [Flavobacterium aquariorum]|uniref:PKD domain-containing protein n=1 Tax=Flavobacterium aquariorum TaxID=2217670 RepID=A0A2W7TTN7_9FLAO|nr:PKD domain-containing protein [Flavobacterium aquariorum]PZX93873.1 PKD domain-containing protein [Flavobacterium aquariorum]